MTATYVPGELATLVTEGGVVLAPADRLTEVAALAGSAPETWATALAALPEVAVLHRDGDALAILVRGGYVVRVGGLSIDGRAAASGTATSTPLVTAVAVEVGPLAGGAAAPVLPIGTGVVRSAGVRWCPLGEPPAPAPAPAPASAPAAPEHTVVRGAAGPAPTGPPPGWTPAEPSTDHDGRTITPAQLQAIRASATSTPPSSPPSSPPPPPAPAAPVPPTPPPVRPLVALRLSTGRVVPVRRRVLVGRSPRVQQVGGSANLPALVTIDDPYVSGTHLEVSSDGVRVTATDTSTNGTLLTRPGQIPVPLDRGVPTEVATGDVLTLSKGITATIVPARETEG